MIAKIKGTNDILPGALGEDIFVSEKWQYLEQKAAAVAAAYGYKEIRTPVFEQAELFIHGLGDVSDVVQKEMFRFEDRGGRDIVLRPEGTASIVRACLENAVHKKQPVTRLYYCGPMFRAERPQKGRYRQFHQFGVEFIGAAGPSDDVEVIALFWTILRELGIEKMQLLINSVGCDACRPGYLDVLRAYFKDQLNVLCADCKDRHGRNVLRMLDCKNPGCQSVLDSAPAFTDYLCDACGTSFEEVKKQLELIGIPYSLHVRMVRGLDYYTKTAFEIVHTGLGAQSTIVGGGRYDKLFSMSGGPEVPAVGAAFGIERMLLAVESEGRSLQMPAALSLSLILLDDALIPEARKLLYSLREAGIRVLALEPGRQLAKQLKSADREGADFAVFIGGDEWTARQILVKDLKAKQQCILEQDSDPCGALLTFLSTTV